MMVSVTQECVSPSKAAEYLEKNTNNRNPIRGNILKYSRDMANGKWRITGDTIKFDKNGVLIDGQNRLMAVIESEQNIDFLIVRGLDPEAKMSTDIGTPRNVNHMMNFEGEKHTTTLAAIARLGFLHESGVLGKTGNSQILSIAEILEFVTQNPTCRDAAKFTSSNRTLRVLLSPSTMGFVRFITAQIDENKSDLFFECIDVTPASRNHPCRVLRETLTNAKLRARRGTSVSPTLRLAMTIKTWNAFYENRDIAMLKWIQGEQFPQFKGYPPR